MNKVLFTFLTALIIFDCSLNAKAQEDVAYAVVSYQNALPVGSFKKYIDAYSYNGANIELNYFVTDNISLGASFSWQKYYQKIPSSTYQIPGGAITATQYHWLRQIPLKLQAHYFVGTPDKLFRPYVALGLGAVSTVQETTIADYVIRTSVWNFISTPEIGLTYKSDPESSWGGITGVKYDFTGYNENNIGNLQALLFHLGVYFEVE
jgi:outer membrane protein W